MFCNIAGLFLHRRKAEITDSLRKVSITIANLSDMIYLHESSQCFLFLAVVLVLFPDNCGVLYFVHQMSVKS